MAAFVALGTPVSQGLPVAPGAGGRATTGATTTGGLAQGPAGAEVTGARDILW